MRTFVNILYFLKTGRSPLFSLYMAKHMDLPPSLLGLRLHGSIFSPACVPNGLFFLVATTKNLMRL
ncbi:hypothetical protein JAAARDRAFT_341894 [Jaapia argillacea MUCL 33604]|uniref:Uncharacterized protein n=1 Tax=Jaapia argillacea MUCL 33604 TaxID=933084 RepID=A0A067PJQ3_9AGAM|nr:hypothetical protein JAAARDRAFT_341894 [Jaapia argillacea MUCL 33604]